MYKYLSILFLFLTVGCCKNKEVSVQEPEEEAVIEKMELEDVIINPLLKEHFKWVKQDVECEFRDEMYLFYGFSFLKVNGKDLIYMGANVNPPIGAFNPDDPDYSFAKALQADKDFIGFKEYDGYCLFFFNSLPDRLFNNFIDITTLSRNAEVLYSLRPDEQCIYDGNRYTSEIYSPEKLVFIEKKPG